MQINFLLKGSCVKEEPSSSMLFWFTALAMVLHIQTVAWLKRPVLELPIVQTKPMEMVILPPLVKPKLEPIVPKPEIKPLPPKVEPKPMLKAVPKPILKPQPAMPKAVEAPKVAPVKIAAPVVQDIPVAKAVTAPLMPVATVPAQAVSAHQVSPNPVASATTSHAKSVTANEVADADTFFKGSIISSHKPNYPSSAKNRHLEGNVTVLYKVNADGSVDEVSVSNSSGYEILDEAALDAAREDSFAPARRGNKPVASTYSRVFTFHLTDSD